ncbi:MAG: RluA family pseudouridine synthase [Treponema sp.]|jgi:23S rRNA pseudouridine1911/1915/1917 synthase|nr:RluA family pseudouridine synthase [Treponema sp.]
MPSYTGTIAENFSLPLRLDRYVSERLGLLSRSQLKSRCIEAKVNGKLVKISRLLKGGDWLELNWSESEPLDLIPENLPLNILYEDANVVLVNKEQGMVVHPGAGNRRGTLANALLFRRLCLHGEHSSTNRSSQNLSSPESRLGIVHRLDKDTSGVIIAAYNNEALAFLAEQFKTRQVRKTYIAIVQGTPKESSGTIETYITRDPHDRKRFTVSTNKGKQALTSYRVLRSWGAYSLVLLRPRTGRTHQLRVHLLHLGHPILGDPIYGASTARNVTLMLHAKSLRILLPGGTEPQTFRAPLPPRFGSYYESNCV